MQMQTETPAQAKTTQTDKKHSPKTPLEFAQRYAELTQHLDASGVNTLVSDHMTIAWPDEKPQTTYTKAEQLVALTEIYRVEKAAGKKLRAADYVITQHSQDFAIVKFTWEVEDPAKEKLSFAHTSYIIRRESDGWRLLFVMELGPAFDGTHQAEFSSPE